jgi:hypothetical protein
MKMKKVFYFVMASFLILTSCEKDIELDIKGAGNTIVINGSITDQAGPYTIEVARSTSINELGSNKGITNALVTIEDNKGNKETLTHKGNGKYQTVTTKGLSGVKYTLNVSVDGKTYTSESTMPARVPLVKLETRVITFGPNERNVIVPHILDNPELGNNYRHIVTVNDTLDKTIDVITDNVNNGKLIQRPYFSNDLEFKKGDKVVLETQCIDAKTYLYFFTLSQVVGGGPGGGTTPSNPPNGFTNGALGIFSAHTVEKKTVIIP